MKGHRSLSWKYVYLAWAEILNIARDFSAYLFIHLFLHDLCALKSNLSDNILYLVTFDPEIQIGETGAPWISGHHEHLSF